MITHSLWRELGGNMRALRLARGLSLRQIEANSGWRRGTLSLAENGKARPGWELVRWYDTTLGADGLLTSMYLEARSAIPEGGRGSRIRAARAEPGDAAVAAMTEPVLGELVEPGGELKIVWTVTNTGSVRWRDRRLLRIGAPAGTHLVHSAAEHPLPDLEPGDTVEGILMVRVPQVAGTYAAYWGIAGENGHLLDLDADPLRIVLVVPPVA